jgi:hypothetical protein
VGYDVIGRGRREASGGPGRNSARAQHRWLGSGSERAGGKRAGGESYCEDLVIAYGMNCVEGKGPARVASLQRAGSRRDVQEAARSAELGGKPSSHGRSASCRVRRRR